jgi:hypothetical protein
MDRGMSNRVRVSPTGFVDRIEERFVAGRKLVLIVDTGGDGQD